MDQSRREGGARSQVLSFEPPKLASIGGGRISRSATEVGALGEARAQGRAEAMAELDSVIEGHRRATTDAAAASQSLAGALDQLHRTDLTRVHDVEQQVLRLALALAEEIVGREIRTDDGLVVAAATRALSLAPDRGPVLLRVNPADVAAVRAALDLETAETPAGHLSSTVQVMADPSIERAGAVAEVGPLRIDAQISSAIARIREAFAP